MILIILAAGRGSRLKNKTNDCPKCLVKVNGKPIIDFMENFINNFHKTFIVCGYKKNQLEQNFDKNKKINFIFNKDYRTTNMVHSLFLINQKHIGNNDIVISYSDIIFDEKIYKNFKKKQSLITIYKNWYKYWKKRMAANKIRQDAEDLVIDKKKVLSIGEKIKNKFPKYQFMGLTKLTNKDFLKLKKFYIKNKNKKIDFTSFLNMAIQSNIINLKYAPTNKFWFEIDNNKDIKVVEKIINN